MSTTTEVITATEAQILDHHAHVAEALDTVRAHICTVAREGAALGHHIEGWMEQHHIRTDEDFWSRLRTLGTGIREDVIRFAMRARRAQRRCALLDDPSQLTFALADGDAPTNAKDATAPKRHESNEILIFTGHIQRTLGFFSEWEDKEPRDHWTPAQRSSVIDSLEPLVKLYHDLGGEG